VHGRSVVQCSIARPGHGMMRATPYVAGPGQIALSAGK
jgi:hypothetical protein